MKKILILPVIMILSMPLMAGKKGEVSHQGGTTGKKPVNSILPADTPDVPVIGREIPGLSLDSYQGGAISRINLESYRGRWLILFFYPADFTFVCPTELHDLSRYYNDFTAGGAEVLAISTDSAYVHRAWQTTHPLLKDVRFPMVSDRAGILSRALGVYNGETGCAIRASFIVDPDGRIMAAEYTHDSIGRNCGELLRLFDAAVSVRKGGGGMCPANWTEGSEMIKVE